MQIPVIVTGYEAFPHDSFQVVPYLNGRFFILSLFDAELIPPNYGVIGEFYGGQLYLLRLCAVVAIEDQLNLRDPICRGR